MSNERFFNLKQLPTKISPDLCNFLSMSAAAIMHLLTQWISNDQSNLNLIFTFKNISVKVSPLFFSQCQNVISWQTPEIFITALGQG
jgi:hypothetical protein